MQEILCANKISKSYGDKEVLRDINVSLNEGELVCLLGVSGVGKTTLFNILSGLMKPDSGRLFLKKAIVIMKKNMFSLKRTFHLKIVVHPSKMQYMKNVVHPKKKLVCCL